MTDWPRGPLYWQEGQTLYASIPFTWNLPDVKALLLQRDMFYSSAVVGGPAVELMPDYLEGLAKISHSYPGILQRINPEATRTTIGCPNHCQFCAVPIVEPEFAELEDWPDLPIICDNNLLAASVEHFDRVIDRLVVHGWADFNQGLDARLLTLHHARRLAEIKRPTIRLALDTMEYANYWAVAYERLRAAGIAKSNIKIYVLVAFDSAPAECWQRCEFVEAEGIQALPQWFHRLDALTHNEVTKDQQTLGWTEDDRLQIMGWYYKHRGAKP